MSEKGKEQRAKSKQGISDSPIEELNIDETYKLATQVRQRLRRRKNSSRVDFDLLIEEMKSIGARSDEAETERINRMQELEQQLAQQREK